MHGLFTLRFEEERSLVEALIALVVETGFKSSNQPFFTVLTFARLLQAKHSPIDFDYLGYNKLRLNEYQRKKEFVFGLLPASRRLVRTA